MPYTTLPGLKSYLKITENTDDALLTDAIDDAQKYIEEQTNRVFEATTLTRYYQREDLSFENRQVLFIDDDLLTITTLTNGDDSATVIPITEYVLIPRNDGPPYNGVKLNINSSYIWEFDTDQWASVLGTWGYSVLVPNDIRRATLRLAGFFYRQRDSQIFDTIAVPEAGVITIPAGMERTMTIIIEKYKRYL